MVTNISQDAVRDLLSAATAAPSVCNSQPWRFRLPQEDMIELWVDASREPKIDPTGRESAISCGAALFNLRIAIADGGREPVVRLLPRPAEPALLASVRIAGKRRAANMDRRLYQAVFARRTNRYPFLDRPIPVDVGDSLHEAARLEGADLWFPRDYWKSLVIERVAEAERGQHADPAYRAEIRRWITDDTGRDDGVPSASLGPRPDDPAVPLRDFDPGFQRPRGRRVTFETTLNLALLETTADRLPDWLRAGQALQRVLLTATIHGLAASFLTQPLEYGDLRWQLHDTRRGIGHVQMILRLGYGRRSSSPTPRRAIRTVVDPLA